MRTMMELLRELYPLRLAPVSSGADRAAEILCEELPFDVTEYPAGSEHNGWVIPQKWEVEKAEIRKDDRVVYDGLAHPLGVIGYSASFEGTVDLEELKNHLFHHPENPEALVYHYTHFYRPWEDMWGFTVPRSLYDALEPGEYEVELRTRREPGTMKVLEYVVDGARGETVTFAAHTCHAGQANDDISGVVVGVQLMRELAVRRPELSYRLLLGPEQFSSIFFLANLPEKHRHLARYCIYLESLGNDDRLALQRSFHGDTQLDRAAEHHLRWSGEPYHVGDFREVIGNDETVWEAPGYEIPTISLSRVRPLNEGLPYPEYHSDQDTADIISETRLAESVEVVFDICRILETDRLMERRFEGHVALSNPSYDLFIDSFDPAEGEEWSDARRRWVKLMTRLPRYFDGSRTVLEIADEHGLPYSDVRRYVSRFEEKGLVDLYPSDAGAVAADAGEGRPGAPSAGSTGATSS